MTRKTGKAAASDWEQFVELILELGINDAGSTWLWLRQFPFPNWTYLVFLVSYLAECTTGLFRNNVAKKKIYEYYVVVKI